MNMNEYKHEIMVLPMELINVESLQKYILTIYNGSIVPYLDKKDFQIEWKSGIMFKKSKNNISVFCVGYNSGQLSFFVNVKKKNDMGNEYYVLDYKGDFDYDNDKTLNYYFKKVSDFIFETLKSKQVYFRIKQIDKNFVNTYIEYQRIYQDFCSGAETINPRNFSNFTNVLFDLSLIKLYLEDEN